MDWIDKALEAVSLVTVNRHQEEITEVRRRERAVARRQLEQNLKSVSDAHAAALANEVASSRGLGFDEGRAFERQDIARREREAREEAERLEREAALERAKWLVSPNPLPISQHIAKFQSDVNGRLEYPPEPDQWDMILSDCPATYVIAGAGSGKSTSLVLRVLLLNLYAEIDRGQISVFTFTRASRADFIKKYRERMDEWGCPISEDEAKAVVRTFHSMVLKMARSAMHPRPVVLELLDREKEGPVQDFDVDNLLELTEKEAEAEVGEEAETGEAGDEEDSEEEADTPTQDDLLSAAYERAIQNDEFRGLALQLLKLSLAQTRVARDKNTDGNKQRSVAVDEKLTSALDKAWREKIAPTLWPMVGVECSISKITVSSQVAEQFWVNGFVPQIGAHVVLGGAEYCKHADKEDVPSSLSINRKRKLLRAISEKPIIWIDKPEQLTELRTLLRWLTAYVDKRTEVPNFKLIAPGDFKRRHITKAFLGLAQFVENLGLPVADTLANVAATKENNLGRDVIFMRATALFWPCFEAVLEERGIKTFNQLFAHFSEDKPENFALVPSYVLGAMRHLLIDEFQDVSPQIVKWVKGCQRELVRRNMAGSLTCVGDDWQSIYGWRGSSPDYFIRFKDHFPAKTHGKITLADNFRSSDHILRCAESTLFGVAGMEPKTCRAKGGWANSVMPVEIVEVKQKLPYGEIRQYISDEVERVNPTDKHPLLVLSRSRKAHAPLSKSPSPSWGERVKFMTYHGSKGLESQSVVLLEDCHYWGMNPLKNYLYKKADLGSYDEAQKAESRRLAYVGITRAMEACRWYGVKKDGGAMGSIPKGKPFASTIAEEWNSITRQKAAKAK